MTPLDTIAEGERLLERWIRGHVTHPEHPAYAEFQRLIWETLPALLAVARAAAKLSRNYETAHSNWVADGSPDDGLLEDECLGIVDMAAKEIDAALDRLTPENPDAT